MSVSIDVVMFKTVKYNLFWYLIMYEFYFERTNPLFYISYLFQYLKI